MLFPILMEYADARTACRRCTIIWIWARWPRTAICSVAQAIAVVLVHTGAMLIVMGTVAIAVYQWIGLQILRSAWINLDTIWAIALIAAGFLSLII